ncbi:MAG: NADP-dependent oxidoreductase [Gammaproteobacteria bacterium]|nr:MAG: NADP-dependent oxidoreductase [Gammaproteobacteria bacterium]
MTTLRIAGTLVLAQAASLALNAGAALGADLPQTMKAAAIDRTGGPEVITLHTLPVPKPAADEVVIAIDTAGVASWDVYLRTHPQAIKHSAFPLVLGTDGAGTVAAVGEKVKRFKVGDQVYSYSWDNPHGGFYAEYVAVPAERVGHVPQGLTLQQAGAVATTGLTAIQGIDDALRLKAGDTLIIHGASGGVGSLALQFAKLRGVKVLATASGDRPRGRRRSARLRRRRLPRAMCRGAARGGPHRVPLRSQARSQAARRYRRRDPLQRGSRSAGV